jgi:hypothetical protein
VRDRDGRLALIGNPVYELAGNAMSIKNFGNSRVGEALREIRSFRSHVLD